MQNHRCQLHSGFARTQRRSCQRAARVQRGTRQAASAQARARGPTAGAHRGGLQQRTSARLSAGLWGLRKAAWPALRSRAMQRMVREPNTRTHRKGAAPRIASAERDEEWEPRAAPKQALTCAASGHAVHKRFGGGTRAPMCGPALACRGAPARRCRWRGGSLDNKRRSRAPRRQRTVTAEQNRIAVMIVSAAAYEKPGRPGPHPPPQRRMGQGLGKARVRPALAVEAPQRRAAAAAAPAQRPPAGGCTSTITALASCVGTTTRQRPPSCGPLIASFSAAGLPTILPFAELSYVWPRHLMPDFESMPCGPGCRRYAVAEPPQNFPSTDTSTLQCVHRSLFRTATRSAPESDSRPQTCGARGKGAPPRRARSEAGLGPGPSGLRACALASTPHALTGEVSNLSAARAAAAP